MSASLAVTAMKGSLSPRAHVVVILITLATIAFIVRLVRTGRLRAKYSVLWLSIGLGLVVLAAVPGVLVRVSESVGIYYPPATFLLLAVVLLFVLAVHSSWELSRLEDHTRRLAEDLALLREEVLERNDTTGPEPVRLQRRSG